MRAFALKCGEWLKEHISDKIMDIESIQALFEHTPGTGGTSGTNICFIQIILVVTVWIAMREQYTYWVTGWEDNILLYIAEIFFIVIFHVVTTVIGKFCIQYKKISHRGAFLLYEYDTVYHKKFLKEYFRPARIIFLYMKNLLFMERVLWFLFKDYSIEKLIYFYIIFCISNVFDGYTRREYELKLNKIPADVRENAIESYVTELKRNKGSEILLMEKLMVNRLPELLRKTEFETLEEQFLYNNTNNLDHLELLKRLMNNESVLTDTPFYQDMNVALFLPLHQALLQGKKIIVFSGGSESREEIIQWINEGIMAVTRMDEFWRVVSLADKIDDWDIGMISMDDLTMLYDIKDLLINPAGFVIVLLHPAKLLTEAQNELYEWGYLLSLEQIKPVYVVIERPMLGLLDVVSHIFRTEFKYVSRVAEPAATTSIYVLDSGRKDVYINKLNMTSLVGMGGVAAVSAQNAKVGNIEWMVGDKLPLYDMNSILVQHTTLIMKSGKRSNATDVPKVVQGKPGLWGVKKRKSAFLIMEDDINNLLELSRQSASRGSINCAVTIVSERYLLRQFMIDNLRNFFDDIYAVSAMACSFSEISLNRSVVLMKLLLFRGMSAEEIKIYRSRYSSADSIADDKVLTQAEKSEIIEEIKRCIGGKAELKLHRKYNQDNKKIYTYHLVQNKELLRMCKELTAPAVYFDEEENKITLLGGKHFWQVTQEYLPGQIVTLSGKLYRIIGLEQLYIDCGWEQVLKVRRYREGIIYQQRYYQDRRYRLNGTINMDEPEHKFGMTWGSFYVPFEVKTAGYYTVWSEDNRDKVEYTVISSDKYDRKYGADDGCRKNGIALKFDNWGEEWQQREVFIIILNEVLKTLFPEGYHYLAVLAAADNEQDNNNLRYLHYELERNADAAQYSILILEDSRLELGILNMINRHMEHILRIVYSYCVWWNGKKGEERDKSSFWALDEWKNAMDTMQDFAAGLHSLKFHTLMDFRRQTSEPDFNTQYTGGEQFCPGCWEIVSEKKEYCNKCKNSFLTQEDYDQLYEIACWQLDRLFGLQFDIPVRIEITNTEKQKEPVLRKNTVLYCKPDVQVHAALGNLVRQMVLILAEDRYSSKDKIASMECKKNVLRAVADWYEIYFMNKFLLNEYASNRKQWLTKGKGKEAQAFEKLCRRHKFDADKGNLPLDNVIRHHP